MHTKNKRSNIVDRTGQWLQTKHRNVCFVTKQLASDAEVVIIHQLNVFKIGLTHYIFICSLEKPVVKTILLPSRLIEILLKEISRYLYLGRLNRKSSYNQGIYLFLLILLHLHRACGIYYEIRMP